MTKPGKSFWDSTFLLIDSDKKSRKLNNTHQDSFAENSDSIKLKNGNESKVKVGANNRLPAVDSFATTMMSVENNETRASSVYNHHHDANNNFFTNFTPYVQRELDMTFSNT